MQGQLEVYRIMIRLLGSLHIQEGLDPVIVETSMKKFVPTETPTKNVSPEKSPEYSVGFFPIILYMFCILCILYTCLPLMQSNSQRPLSDLHMYTCC